MSREQQLAETVIGPAASPADHIDPALLSGTVFLSGTVVGDGHSGAVPRAHPRP
ncbi:hypothetical protein [Streptomyces spinosirectus]